MTQNYHGFFNLNYYLPFLFIDMIFTNIQQWKKKYNEIMSNNENLSFTSAKAVLSLFMSPAGEKKQNRKAFFRGT